MNKRIPTMSHSNPVAKAATRLSYGSGAHGKTEKAKRNQENSKLRSGRHDW